MVEFPTADIENDPWYQVSLVPRCDRQNHSPKDVYALIPRTCDYVTLRGKRDSADMINIKDLKMERLSWIT